MDVVTGGSALTICLVTKVLESFLQVHLNLVESLDGVLPVQASASLPIKPTFKQYLGG